METVRPPVVGPGSSPFVLVTVMVMIRFSSSTTASEYETSYPAGTGSSTTASSTPAKSPVRLSGAGRSVKEAVQSFSALRTTGSSRWLPIIRYTVTEAPSAGVPPSQTFFTWRV